MKDNDKKTEKLLLDMQKQKVEADKSLLTIEIVMGVITLIVFFVLVLTASIVEMEESLKLLIILPATALVIVICFVALKIEQIAGYYECRKCHYRYVPTYSSVLWAMHIGRTRYMKCPKCNKRSWNKKVINK